MTEPTRKECSGASSPPRRTAGKVLRRTEGCRISMDAPLEEPQHSEESVGNGARWERRNERIARNSGSRATPGSADRAFPAPEHSLQSRRKDHSRSSTTCGRFRAPGQALRYFRKFGRLVIVCSRWVSPITKHRDEQMRSFSDVASDLEGSLRQRQLEIAGSVFNKSDYCPEKELTISKEVEKALQLSPEERTDDMIKQMMISLRTLQAFAEYPIHIQERLCRVAQYHLVPPGRIILREGHQGEYFYIVIAGRGQIKAVSRNINTGEVTVDNVNTLKRGHKFGDVALLQRMERTATVESVTKMRLLAVEKCDFAEIFLKESADSREPEYITFLRKVDFLRYFPLERLGNCGSNCIFQYFSSGKVVVADSKVSDYLYVVKSGSCRVLKQLKAKLPSSVTAAAESLAVQRLAERRTTFASIESTDEVLGPDLRRPFLRRALTDWPLPPKESIRVSCGMPRRRSSSTAGGSGSTSGSTDERSLTPGIAVPRFEFPPLMRVAFTDSAGEVDGNLCDSVGYGDDEDECNVSSNRKKVILNYSSGSRNNRLPVQAAVTRRLISRRSNKRVDKLRAEPDAWRRHYQRSGHSHQSKNEGVEYVSAIEKAYTELPGIRRGRIMLSHEGSIQSLPAAQHEKARTDNSWADRAAFVQLAVLKPTDTFGLDTLAFDPHFHRSEISVTLVSNGSELILINKAFFLQNCNEATLRHLRIKVSPSPTERQLQHALSVLLEWDIYKKCEVASLNDDKNCLAHRNRDVREILPLLLQRYTFL